MKKIFYSLAFLSFLLSCENHRFDPDKRQLEAKDQILRGLHKVSAFDIKGFHEDTINTAEDPNFKKLIQYSLDIEYLDSNKVLQRKKGIVLFAPDGQSVISSKIIDR